MSGGRLRLDVLASGAVVPAFQLQDAVHAGILEGGHGVAAYWYGKNKAFSLFGTPPAFGWNANGFLAWMNYGGGYDLYNELVQSQLKLNLVGFLSGPMPAQPLGWFKRELKTADDFKGLKYRTVGLAADLQRQLGTAVTILAGGEIVPALERGVIDGAEFNNPSSDSVLGFADVSKIYMLRSYHQATETFEIMFNKAKYDGLPAELKAIVKYAAESASADMSWKALDRYSKDLEALRGRGVNVIATPETILKAQLDAWNRVIDDFSKDAFFKKVIDSQRAWVQRTYGYERANEPSRDMAFDHFFRRA
jgi:TRAP-type mannitol/chloroaromatic compound transport system substrate-binding protein